MIVQSNKKRTKLRFGEHMRLVRHKKTFQVLFTLSPHFYYFIVMEGLKDDWFTESSSHPFQMSHFELLWLNWFHSEESKKTLHSSDYEPYTCFSIFEAKKVTFWFIILSHSLSSPKIHISDGSSVFIFLFNSTWMKKKSL